MSMLSLSQRAGKLISGEESVEIAIKNNEAVLVLIAGDASENTKKKFNDKAKSYGVEVFEISDRQTLSGAIGKYNRAVFCVTDVNFANRMKAEL